MMEMEEAERRRRLEDEEEERKRKQTEDAARRKANAENARNKSKVRESFTDQNKKVDNDINIKGDPLEFNDGDLDLE
jgi:predicted RecB family nuclease